MQDYHYRYLVECLGPCWQERCEERCIKERRHPILKKNSVTLGIGFSVLSKEVIAADKLLELLREQMCSRPRIIIETLQLDGPFAQACCLEFRAGIPELNPHRWNFLRRCFGPCRYYQLSWKMRPASRRLPASLNGPPPLPLIIPQTSPPTPQSNTDSTSEEAPAPFSPSERDPDPDENIYWEKCCCLCLERPSEVLFQPCRHAVICLPCREEFLAEQGQCPICRGTITEWWQYSPDLLAAMIREQEKTARPMAMPRELEVTEVTKEAVNSLEQRYRLLVVKIDPLIQPGLCEIR